jgi:LacI family transcriptional regulator
MSHHRTTQRDVARYLGIHVSTVSMALRRHPSLPPATWERVKEAAKKLNYLPDPALSALMEYRRNAVPKHGGQTLAYLTAWATPDEWKNSDCHELFYTGAQRRAIELGYSIETLWLREPGIAKSRWNGILKTRNYSGLIVAPLPTGRGHLRLDWESFCAVKIDMSMVWPPLFCVGNNQIQMMRLAIRSAWQHGYRRIGFACRKTNNERTDRFWSAAYLDELDRLAGQTEIPMHLPVEWNATSLAKWMKKFRPEVVISLDRHVPDWLADAGFSIPGDVGFIDLHCWDFSGKRAGIRQHHDDVGSIAVDTLDGLIYRNQRGIPAISRITLVDGSWVDGATIEQKRHPKQTRSKPRHKNISRTK